MTISKSEDSKYISGCKCIKELEKLKNKFKKNQEDYKDYNYTSKYLHLSRENIEELYNLSQKKRNISGYGNNTTNQKNSIGVSSKYWGGVNSPMPSIAGYTWENKDRGRPRGWHPEAPIGVDTVKMLLENEKSSRLPNSRVISNSIAKTDSIKLNDKVNQLHTFWGQLMDHDFSIAVRSNEKQVMGTLISKGDELYEKDKKVLTSLVGGRVGMYIYDKKSEKYREVGYYDKKSPKGLYTLDNKKPICEECLVYQLNGIDSYFSCNTIYSSDKNIQFYLRESKKNKYGELLRDSKGQLQKTGNLLFSKIISPSITVQMPTYGEILVNNGVKHSLLTQLFEANGGKGCALDSKEWKKVENDPYFIHWLDVPDRFTGKKYGQPIISEVNARVNFSLKDISTKDESHTWGACLLLCHYSSGDIRCNEHLGLTQLHTILFKRHYFHCNNIINTSRYYGLKYSEDDIFNMSKLLVVADYQHITCTDYLDILVGRDKKDNLLEVEYDENCDATISTEFSGAAYRLGHFMVQDQLLSKLELVKAFLDPHITHKIGDALAIVELMFTQQKEIDGTLTSTLRNQLLGFSGKEGAHLDLYGINTTRGREMGLSSYTKVRNSLFKYGGKHSNKGYYSDKIIKGNPWLKPIKSWEDAKDVFREEFWGKLKDLYRDVKDIDLFVGLMCEKPMDNSLIGPTCTFLIKEQMFRLVAGDRYFYTHLFSDSLKSKVSTLKEILLESTKDLELWGPDNAFEIQQSNRDKYIRDFEKFDSNILKLQYKTIYSDL